ncbi:uncharacterized protein LOC117181221 [Belonocnema kinseyi]|uniref:uncharacterized protein LOC117181221 n=1 Tax=Belonocnema kinseyi TaxID=2817044 RepID=UPI00143D9804|nr:uncharacterized protein LOC117181221 [Belonocnema kinseyi]
MSKRPSGAECRKFKKRREEEDRQNANRKLMDKYILLQISTILSSEEAIPFSSSEPLPTSTPSEVLPIYEKNIEEPEVPIDTLSTNYNDPTSWPPMSDKIKQILVAHGPDQVFGDSNRSKHLANSAEGFNDWKHLSPTLPDHENSIAHRDNYVKWKLLEKNIENNVLINDYVISQFEEDKKKWREILKVIIDAILFCASNNLALRGSVEQIGNPQADIFLNLIEFASHYNPTLKVSIENHKKGSVSYFSPKIQNESPMKKTGKGLASEILDRLQEDNLNINDVRGQGYDNGANMAGKYQGVQSRILNLNKYAT